jgi:glycogen debranching enzyme
MTDSSVAERLAAEAELGAFFVSVGSSREEKRSRTLKHGDTFAVLDQHGDIVAGDASADGIYHKDTRYLSRFELLIEGARPVLLSSSLREDNAALISDLTNPDIHRGGELVLPHDTIHMRRTKFLWAQRYFERLLVRSFSTQPQRLALAVQFDADFKDLFEVRGSVRKRHGRHLPARYGKDTAELGYVGLDDIERSTNLRFDPPPQRLEKNTAVFDLDLAPGAYTIVFLEIWVGRVDDERPGRVAYLASARQARRNLQHLSSQAASITTSDDVFNEAARRSVADIYMLVTQTPWGPYPYAGIPWFSAPFGRDAIITALEILWMDPSIAKGVLRYLAAHQATSEDPAADAEPGKILHEVRQGEMARLGEVPFRCYYGSVDSTPLFIMLADAYLSRTGDVQTLRELWPNIVAALAWIDNYGDRDGDGFVEYGTRAADGLTNQGWKDSHDAIFHADGRMAKGPIALCEVQGYVYAAKQGAARIAIQLGHGERASALVKQADTLRDAFDKAFWVERLDSYALALDGTKQACEVLASNAGHALYAGIGLPERAAPLARALMGSSSFSGWGIRTVASTEARYNPMSYHNGSVWPHDSAIIGMGLARYGYKEHTARILEGLFAASVHMDQRRLPELLCGFPRRRGQGPTSYPVSCSPQAWAAGSSLSLVQACLGLEFDTKANTIRLNRPMLPPSLSELTLRHLKICDSSVDIAVRQVGHDVAVNVVRRQGSARVVVVH